jgi:LacI family transcriptional regulator
MRDVAALAGVGLMTVSRVVNGVESVAPELRERVLDAIQKLDYRHNKTASRMRSVDRHGGMVALCVENVDHPFSSGIHRGLEDAVRAHGFLVFSASSDGDPETEHRLIEAFCERQVDGLVILPVGHDHSFLTARIRRGLGVVYVDRPALALPADTVMTEHEGGAYLGVKHLIDGGHRQIAFLGQVDEYPTSARYAGYVRALEGAGLRVDPRMVRTGVRTVGDAGAAVKQLFDAAEPPTALFTAADLLSMGARLALHDLGIETSIAQVGFDDFQMANALVPALSVYEQDPVAIGRRCGELLLERLDADIVLAARSFVMPGRLLSRGSGEIPAEPR